MKSSGAAVLEIARHSAEVARHIRDTNTKILAYRPEQVSISQYVRGNAERIGGVLSILAGSDRVLASADIFSYDDVGKTIMIYEAATGGETLTAIITAFMNAREVTIDTSATLSVYNKDGVMGSDASSPVAMAIASLGDRVGKLVFEQGGTYLFTAPVTISQHSLIVDGQDCTILADTQSDGTGGGDSAYNYNVFTIDGSRFGILKDPMTMGCKNIVIENFLVENIGQTYGPATDDHYWTTLNGVTTAYNRNYNKHINYGAFVVYNQANNVIVRNIKARNIGGLVYHISWSGSCHIENCVVYGWGNVCISPGPDSTISGCYLEQTAPPLNQTDSNADRGTSHCIYVTSSYDRVKIINNTIIRARLNALKFLTGTNFRYYGAYIAGNTFERAHTLWQIQPEPSQADGESEFIFTENYVYRCGRIYSAGGGNFTVIIHDNVFDDKNDEPSDATVAGAITVGDGTYAFGNVWSIKNNVFKNMGADQATTHSCITIYTDNYPQVHIDSNYFDDTSHKYSVQIVAGTPGSPKIRITNNTFYQTLRIDTTAIGSLDDTIIANNTFYVVQDNMTIAALLLDTSGGKIIGNNIGYHSSSYGIYAGNSGTDETLIARNIMYPVDGVASYGMRIAHAGSVHTLIYNKYYGGALWYNAPGAAMMRVDGDTAAKLRSAPITPEDGDIVYANAAFWDPGSGSGFYGYEEGAWVKL